MPEIISNSSCLIALDNIRMLYILKELYGAVHICEEVFEEFGKSVDDWIQIDSVKNNNYFNILNNIIDKGESGTIALSLEIPESIMILDDLKARKIAKNLNLKHTGLLGIIVRAKHKGVIDSAKDILEKLKAANFRISKAVENEILLLANEL